MITINFYLAIALYLVLIVGAVLLAWLLGVKEKDKDLSVDARFIWFCTVCSYTYIDTKGNPLSICPRCNSYNRK